MHLSHLLHCWLFAPPFFPVRLQTISSRCKEILGPPVGWSFEDDLFIRSFVHSFVRSVGICLGKIMQYLRLRILRSVNLDSFLSCSSDFAWLRASVSPLDAIRTETASFSQCSRKNESKWCP